LEVIPAEASEAVDHLVAGKAVDLDGVAADRADHRVGAELDSDSDSVLRQIGAYQPPDSRVYLPRQIPILRPAVDLVTLAGPVVVGGSTGTAQAGNDVRLGGCRTRRTQRTTTLSSSSKGGRERVWSVSVLKLILLLTRTRTTFQAERSSSAEPVV
jgi:hypothetical protein